MDKKTPQKARRLHRRKLRRRKCEWHFDHIVQGATEEKMDRIWDAFIVAVEKEGLVCGGGYHPMGQCQPCRELLD